MSHETRPFRFFGHQDPFSNFHPTPFVVEGKEYLTGEHFFQVAKFWKTDPAWAEAIRQTDDPGVAKRMGGSREHPLHPEWDAIRDDVMRATLTYKFGAYPNLQRLLLETGDREIIENSPMTPTGGVGGTARARTGWASC